MDFEYTQDQKAFREELRNWLQDNLPERWLDGDRQLPDDEAEQERFLRNWQQTLSEGNWAGISWPEQYGGRDATLMEQVIFNQEMARVNAPLMINRIGILFVGPTLMELGTDEQKERFLPQMLNGEEVWCQGYSEPNAGSDLASLQTRAERDGDEFVINGQKIWTSYAHFSDWCFLLARTDDSGDKHQGITALMVPMDQEGVSMDRIRQINDEQEFNQVYFDDAVAKREHVVGEVDEGWEAATTLLSFEHGSTELYQPDKLALEERWEQLVEYCQTHERNGEPLSEDPRIRQRLAEFDTKLQAAKLTNLRYVQEQMESGDVGPKGSMDKVYSSELYKELEDFAVELLGPGAALWGDGHEEGRWPDRYLDAFGTTIAGGTSEIHRNIIAERVLGLPRDITE